MKLIRIAVVILLIVAGGWIWMTRSIDQPQAHSAEGRVITIAPGSSTREIVARLEREGIISSSWLVRIWLRTVGSNLRLKAGDYRFASPISARRALEQVARGQVATRSFTVPEGYNRYDIARLLAGIADLKGGGASGTTDPAALLALFDRVSLIADLDPGAASLEGYLFPDTYEYTTTTTREQLVEVMVRRFRQVFDERLRQRAVELGLTTRQALTLASLIEKEARVDRERELISSVFHRRLREGVPLACDPTVIYASLLAGRYRGKIYRSDLDRDSPYNTYLHAGLPPGPIASPGRRSIEAALSPAQTDYLYFVVDVTKGDGSHLFSARSSDHEAAVRRLREAEREAGRAR